MLIPRVLSSDHSWPLLLRGKRGSQSVGPHSLTRHGWFRLPPIDQYSSLLPPVGVWAVSQSQCSVPLDIVATVGRYPAVQLMSREPIRNRLSFIQDPMPDPVAMRD